MKLGKKNHILSSIIILLFMIFVCISTIGYLYNNNNITKEEYMELLLSDTYGDDFYVNLVEMINKNFNPLSIIEIDEVNGNNFNLYNKINLTNPVVYIYNNNQKEEYKEEYNINPNVLLAAYFLSENLNNKGIETVFEENNIEEFSKNNNLTIEEGTSIFFNDKISNYPSIKYIINLGRVGLRSSEVVKIDSKRYAIISLYANEENISLITELNKKLNEKYNGISKIYFDESYNSSINIDFGSRENTMKEVLNSIEVFSDILVEVI